MDISKLFSEVVANTYINACRKISPNMFFQTSAYT